ncbi:Tenascin-R [Holothuria leucospilota]|uniref:Tenascin-R n=1 Tax=Holothuria leucospilota TaxID=206669 RepID=A0A9Q0YBP4_HOLLE|nr:Tenascin-R [Holothuria leucospilota]
MFPFLIQFAFLCLIVLDNVPVQIIQRRVDGSINFTRDWTDYNDGFGFLNADFWIGNEKLAYLTNQKQYELMINFETETGDSYHVTYNKLRIGDAFSEYTLISVGEFTGMLDNLATSRPPIDCYDIQLEGSTTSGDYTINPNGWFDGPFTINCNMDIDGGGWTVFQRKSGGSQPFNLNWVSYKGGFGTLTGEFWMGNDKLAFLTNQKEYELRIDMTNADGDERYVHHDFFRIADESNHYRMLGLGNHSGTAVFDALRYHHYMGFSTFDRDNDLNPATHCALAANSGWWYYACNFCDLNRPTPYWNNYPGSDAITYSEMKIRPLDRAIIS